MGKVEYISSSRLNLGKLRTEEDILWSFAPHDISAITYLLGETPSRVTAQGASYLNHPISDVTLTIMTFQSGVKAHVFVSWLHPFKEQKLVVIGDRKMAVFDDTRADQKLILYPHRIDWVNRVPIARKAEGEVIAFDPGEPLAIECRHFLESVRDRSTPRTDGENGVQVLRILHAAGQSINNMGQSVEVQKKSAPKFFVHASAAVDQPCEIGAGSKIWHFSHVMAGCRIGKDCNLGQNVHVAPHVVIGNNVKIQNNVSIYTGVELEDDVFCGPSMVFTNVTTPRSHVNRKSEYRRTLVKRGATLGANCTIVCGSTIGEYAFVGAGAVVTRDVPNHALMVGVPARQSGWVCECGVRLQVWRSNANCPSCRAQFILENGNCVQADSKREALTPVLAADSHAAYNGKDKRRLHPAPRGASLQSRGEVSPAASNAATLTVALLKECTLKINKSQALPGPLKTDSPHKTIRVLIHGLAYFSGMFPSILQGDGWDVKQYPPRWSPDLLPMVRCLRDSDLTFLWGGRVTQGKFLSTARLFGKEKIVMFWCGSDVVQGQWERNAGKMDPWVAERIHWAGSPWLADEVRALGLPCEYVPATWVPMVDHFEPLPNKFSVLAFLPLADRMKLYGIDQVLEVALSLPTIEFNIVGLRRGQRLCVPANVRLHGWTPDPRQSSEKHNRDVEAGAARWVIVHGPRSAGPRPSRPLELPI